MTWLAWRQLRAPVLSVYPVLVLVCAALALGRPDGGAPTDLDPWYRGGLFAVWVLPVALGVFWGVPLITRELGAGTHHLVWNQSVTRTRWLAVKLGLGVPAAAVAAGALGLAVTWWSGPLDATAPDPGSGFAPRVTPLVFAARGVAPLGYAAFAFVLGVAVAIALRRTVPAMAVTLLLYAAVQVAVPLVVRPHLLPPTDEVVAITERTVAGVRVNGDVPEALQVLAPPGAWVLTNETVDRDGARVHPLPDAVRHCVPRVPPEGFDRSVVDRMHACFAGLGDLGYRQHLVHHPATHFWPVQWSELALFLALCAPVTWFCFHRLRDLA
ncbi:transporter [Actinosynnema sp. NPDC053489]|uniref:transporter n=1 Tax=Actinosynnema sp. NPDC053489 TaxID=3363916 RepID=UPI0037C6F7AD